MNAWLSLDRLVSPFDVDQFRREYWGRIGVFTRGPVERFGPIAEVPNVWNPHAAALAHREVITVCYPRLWMRNARPTPQPTADYPASESVVLHRLGAGLYLRDFQRHDPMLNAALADLRVCAGSMTGVHCDLFLAGGSEAMRVPLPDGPVFLVQLRGTSTWSLDEPVVDGTNTHAKRLKKAVADAGAVLCLLRAGEMRVRSTEDAVVLVLSVPDLSIVEPVLRRAIASMYRVEALRAPALVPPTAIGRKQARAAAERALAALPGIFREIDSADLVDKRPARHFERVAGVRVSLKPLPGQAGMAVLRLQEKRSSPVEVTLDAAMTQVCEWVLSRRSRFSDVEIQTTFGLDASALAAFVDGMVDAGLLREPAS